MQTNDNWSAVPEVSKNKANCFKLPVRTKTIFSANNIATTHHN